MSYVLLQLLINTNSIAFVLLMFVLYHKITVNNWHKLILYTSAHVMAEAKLA